MTAVLWGTKSPYGIQIFFSTFFIRKQIMKNTIKNSLRVTLLCLALMDASTALGYGNEASGISSSALGHYNIARGDYSSALGFGNEANGISSSALGRSNTASGDYSSAFGANSQAIVDYGTAIGYKSYADRVAWDSSSNNYSAAFVPSDMSAFNEEQKAVWQSTSAALAVGDPNGTGNSTNTIITRQITGVAAGSQDTDAVNVAQLREVANMVGSGGSSFSPISVSGNTGNFSVGSAGRLNIQGDGTNITTTANGGTVEIDLSSALKTQISTAIATVGTLNTTVTGLQTELGNKADKTTVDNLQTDLGKKADKTAVDNLQTELGKKADKTELNKKVDESRVTEMINAAALSGTGVNLNEYAKTADANAYADTAANTAATNAKGYTDSEVAKAKTAANTYADTAANKAKTDAQTYADNAVKDKADQSWVTDQINNAALGGTGVNLSEYAKTADANAYADTAANTAENNAKGYTDSEVAKAKSYADTAANTAETKAKGYTDSKLGDYSTTTDMNKAIDTAKADANKYADTAANKAKTDANAYTDGKLADNATQTWVNNQKFAKQKAVDDLDDRVSKLVVTGGGYEHITVAGENGEFNVANRETAKFVGDGKNITTDATGGEVKISLADNIAVNSVNAGGTVVNQNGVALPSGVALTNGGLNNGGQVISNVAPGVKPTDAVNVSQLNNAMVLSEGRLNARIDRVEKRANAGTAAAMAAGNLQNAAKPGGNSFSISGATFAGEAGYAMGYSTMSSDGKWGFNAFGNGDSRGRFGGGASVGFHW